MTFRSYLIGYCVTYRRDTDGKVVHTCYLDTDTNARPSGAGTFTINDLLSPASISFPLSSLLLGYTDPEGETLFVVGLQTNYGTLSVVNGVVTYTPEDADREVVLSYGVSDGVNVTPATVEFSVLFNDYPTGTPNLSSFSVQEGGSVSIPQASLVAGFSDPEGVALVASAVTSDIGGVIKIGTNFVLSVPANSYPGSVELSWTVSDGVSSIPVSYLVPITDAPNSPPVGSLSMTIVGAPEDSVIYFASSTLLGDITDADGDPLSISNVVSSVGTIAKVGAWWVFTPPANYNGGVALNFTVSDGQASIPVQRSFTVTPVVDAPVDNEPNKVIATVTEWTEGVQPSLTITSAMLNSGFSNPDNVPYTYVILVTPGAGQLIQDSPTSWRYLRELDYNGDALIQINVGGVIYQRLVTVTPVLSAPRLTNFTLPSKSSVSNVVSQVELLAGSYSPDDVAYTANLTNLVVAGAITGTTLDDLEVTLGDESSGEFTVTYELVNTIGGLSRTVTKTGTYTKLGLLTQRLTDSDANLYVDQVRDGTVGYKVLWLTLRDDELLTYSSLTQGYTSEVAVADALQSGSFSSGSYDYFVSNEEFVFEAEGFYTVALFEVPDNLVDVVVFEAVVYPRPGSTSTFAGETWTVSVNGDDVTITCTGATPVSFTLTTNVFALQMVDSYISIAHGSIVNGLTKVDPTRTDVNTDLTLSHWSELWSFPFAQPANAFFEELSARLQ